MFTGLVECTGELTAALAAAGGRRLRFELPFGNDLAVGDSVAVNGCCLTVAALHQGAADFDAGPETLRLTNLGALAIGSKVNFERPLRADGRLGGHIVQGHIDGLGTLLERRSTADWDFLRFDAGLLSNQIVAKGSIAVDGVSLTVVDVVESTFTVMIVPHTSNVTTLGTIALGATVNLEVDILGKYVHQYLDRLYGKKSA